LARRHAEFHCALFERAESEWQAGDNVDWLAVYAEQIDNVRAALDWSFSPNGDLAIGAALAIATVPLWFQLSLMHEYGRRVERVLSHLEPGRDEKREMHLTAAFGAALIYAKGPGPETDAAWSKTLQIAGRLADVDYQARAVFGLWNDRTNRGE